MQIHMLIVYVCIVFDIYFSQKDYKIILDEYHKVYYLQYNFNKTLILYVFDKYNDRVINFINNCIFKHNNYDFLIIVLFNIYIVSFFNFIK